MLKIFISHSTKDIRLVSVLEEYLIKNGITSYVAERDYQPGKLLSEKIISNIDISDYFLVVYTQNGKDSNYVNQEIGYWIKKMGYNNLIPLVEKNIKPEGFLCGVEYIEYDPNNPNIGINNAIGYLHIEKEKSLGSGGVLLGLSIIGLVILVLVGLTISDKKEKQKLIS